MERLNFENLGFGEKCLTFSSAHTSEFEIQQLQTICWQL